MTCKQFVLVQYLIVCWFKWRQRGQDSDDLASSCLVWPVSLKEAFPPCNLLSLDASLKIHIFVCVYIWLCFVICVDWNCHHESSVIATKTNVLHIQRANHVFPWVKKKRDFADGVTISEFQCFYLTENVVSFGADSNTHEADNSPH